MSHEPPSKSNLPKARKILEPFVILQKALARAKKQNPSYSMRSLAKSVGLSPSFISAILKGKKKIPMDRILPMAVSLRMDEAAVKTLRQSILVNWLEGMEGASQLLEDLSTSKDFLKPSSISERDEGTLKEFSVFEKWYQMAILDLVTCHDFNPDPLWISGRLGISTAEAESSLNRLKLQGLIEFRNGQYYKAKTKLRFPSNRSLPTIRAYHKAMITKALEVMLGQTDDKAFEQRMITAISFAVNPQQINKGRARLMELIYEIADIMSEGDCTEVYQLNVQLFPLTRK